MLGARSDGHRRVPLLLRGSARKHLPRHSGTPCAGGDSVRHSGRHRRECRARRSVRDERAFGIPPLGAHRTSVTSVLPVRLGRRISLHGISERTFHHRDAVLRFRGLCPRHRAPRRFFLRACRAAIPAESRAWLKFAAMGLRADGAFACRAYACALRCGGRFGWDAAEYGRAYGAFRLFQRRVLFRARRADSAGSLRGTFPAELWKKTSARFGARIGYCCSFVAVISRSGNGSFLFCSQSSTRRPRIICRYSSPGIFFSARADGASALCLSRGRR